MGGLLSSSSGLVFTPRAMRSHGRDLSTAVPYLDLYFRKITSAA